MKKKSLASFFAAVILSACGGGGGGDGPSSPSNPNAPVEIGGKSIGPGAGRDWTDEEGNEVVLGKTSYLLSDAQKEVAVLDRSVKTLAIPLNVGQMYAVGDVLITDQFDGLLAKITSIRQDSSNTVYEFTPATLAEAFEIFKVNFDNEIRNSFNEIQASDEGNGLSITKTTSTDFMASHMQVQTNQRSLMAAPMVASSQAPTLAADKVSGLSFDLNNFKLMGGELNGHFFLRLDPKIDFNLNRVSSNSDAIPDFTLSGQMNPEFIANTKYKVSIKNGIEHSGTIFSTMSKKGFKKFLWFPVPYKPYFDVNIKTKVEGNGDLEVFSKYHLVSNIGASVSSNKNPTGVLSVSNHLNNVELFGGELGVSQTISLPSVNAGVMLFDTVGAHLTAEFNHGAKTTIGTNNYLGIRQTDIKIDGKADLSIGFKVNELFKSPAFSFDFFNLGNLKKYAVISTIESTVNALLSNFSKTFYERSYYRYVPTLTASGSSQGVKMYIDGALVADLSNFPSMTRPYKFVVPAPGTYSVKLVYEYCVPTVYFNCETIYNTDYSLSVFANQNMRIDDDDSIKFEGAGLGVVGYFNKVGQSKSFILRVLPDGQKLE